MRRFAHHFSGYESNIWKLYAYQFFLSFQLWWPIWVIYLKDERGLTMAQVAGMEGLGAAVVALSEVPTGLVADRYSRKLSLILGGICTALGILIFGLASNYVILLASYFIWSVGITFRSGADNALTFDSLKALGRQADFQTIAGRSWAFFALGGIGSMLLGSRIAERTGLIFPIYLGAAVAALAALVALLLKEPPFHDEQRGRLGYATLIRESVAMTIRLPNVRWAMVLAAIIGAAAVWAPAVFIQPFLENHNVALEHVGDLQAPGLLLSMAGGLLAVKIYARLGAKLSFLLMPLVVGGAYVALGVAHVMWVFPALPLIWAIGGFAQPVLLDYVNHRIPSSHRATILSVRQLAGASVIVVAGPTLGHITDSRSLETAFFVAGVFVLSAGVACALLWLSAHLRSEEAGPALAEEMAAP